MVEPETGGQPRTDEEATSLTAAIRAQSDRVTWRDPELAQELLNRAVESVDTPLGAGAVETDSEHRQELCVRAAMAVLERLEELGRSENEPAGAPGPGSEVSALDVLAELGRRVRARVRLMPGARR